MTDGEKFTVLDSWRGICAVMVALFHFHANNHLYQISLFAHGGLFVDFFFVLSGFVIFANYQTRLEKGFGVARFMLLRFGRLYPLHIALLLAYLGIDWLQTMIPALAEMGVYPPFQGPAQTPDYILAHVLMIHSFAMDRLSFNAPSWSISAEFYTYLVFALAVVFFRKKLFLAILCIMIFAVLYLIFYLGEYAATATGGFFRALYGFGAGALLWMLWTRCEKIRMLKHSVFWNTAEILSVALMLTFVSFAPETPLLYAAPFVFALGIFIFAFEKGAISRVLEGKFFITLGILSYSIYMTHALIGGKIITLSGMVLDKVTGVDGKLRIGAELWQGDLLTLMYILNVILASYITFKLVEEPFRRWFRVLAYRK